MTTILTKAPFFDRGSLLKKLKSLGKSPTEWKGSRELLAEVEKHEPGFTNSSIPTPAEAIAAARGAAVTMDANLKEIERLTGLNKQLAADQKRLDGKLESLLKTIAELKGSKAPAAAVARQLETVTRKTAADLSAARRETGTTTAAEFQAEIAPPRMAREEWKTLPDGARSEWIRRGGKLI